jgi:anthranilate synthase component 2
MVDNYDSFTYNLVQILASEGAGSGPGSGKWLEIDVVRNDAATVDELLERRPRGIVLSPGPGRPEGAGVCLELLGRRPEIPVLGVCLGHQAMAASFGARIVRAPELMHGKTSMVRHDGSELFDGLPDPFEATRYHSLVVDPETVPEEEFEEIAWSDDGVLQGLRHRRLPWWGVQFHPESILTRVGPRLLANFLKICGEAPTPEPPPSPPRGEGRGEGMEKGPHRRHERTSEP